MEKPAAPSPYPTRSLLARADDSPPSVDELIARAVAACAVAKRHATILKQSAEQQLRAVREAGHRLSLVQRSKGGRPTKNSSGGLTSYQRALKEAGISRETANTWRRVADLPEAQFERFIEEARHALGPLTIAKLLDHGSGSPVPARAGRTLKLALSDAAYAMVVRQLDVLGAAHFTATPSDTLVLILGRAHARWLALQKAAPRSGERGRLAPSHDGNVGNPQLGKAERG